MIKSVHDYQIDDVFKKDAPFYYVIPKYQREYTWSTQHWKDLYDDISENELGYFIGSIICIDNSSDAYQSKPLEVVDGQQRLTTLSLLLAAIYTKLRACKDELDEDDEDELPTLRKSLRCSEAPNELILSPQIQGCNLQDYIAVMAEAGIIKSAKKENYWGNRKIARCYKYFLGRLEKDIANGESASKTLLHIKRKVSKAILVKIEVGSHAEAYTLFESLNNRGTPLTAIDLMKNVILARAERAGLKCDDCFDQWQDLLKYLTDDYATQERFFRQYYNAFKGRLNEPFRQSSERKDPLGNMATRSNLLEIYESLINYNLPAFLEDVLACGEIYAKLIFSMEPNGKYARPLKDLAHIQGVPSYVLLLFLFRFQAELEINESLMVGIIKLLISFFVRRNITDVPPTRDLTRIFMGIIQTIEENGLKADAIKQLVQKTLADCSASDALFEEKLKGDIYEDNSMVARFVLCSLTERSMTTETWTDLWEQNATQNGQKVYAWTIEHIFPEGDNIPQDWVNMIAGGDAELAKKYRMEYVHKLGNLTVTRYNSALSNFSFEKKRDRQKDGLYVGYKNGLEINREIAQKDRWTVQDIMARTEELAAELLKIYSLS